MGVRSSNCSFKRVNIHTAKGMVKGIFGWPAIHTRKSGKEKNT